MLLKDPCFSKLSEIIIIILVHLKMLIGYIRSLSEIHYHSKFINYFRIFSPFFFAKVSAWFAFATKVVNNFLHSVF